MAALAFTATGQAPDPTAGRSEQQKRQVTDLALKDQVSDFRD
jgi:hypothetical protein